MARDIMSDYFDQLIKGKAERPKWTAFVVEGIDQLSTFPNVRTTRDLGEFETWEKARDACIGEIRALYGEVWPNELLLQRSDGLEKKRGSEILIRTVRLDSPNNYWRPGYIMLGQYMPMSPRIFKDDK